MENILSFDTIEDVEELQKAYNQAVDIGKETFMFKGNELLTTYAKYMLEHLRNQFPKQ